MERQEMTLPPSVLLNDLQSQLQRLPEGLRSKFLLVMGGETNGATRNDPATVGAVK
ncbi:MAG: hypothetical protein BDTLLHRC_000735 [Candidatus Fervidibacter sp.]